MFKRLMGVFPQKQSQQTPPHLGMVVPQIRGTYKIRHNYANYLIAGDIRINDKTLIGFIGFIEKTANSCGIKSFLQAFIDDAKACKLSEIVITVDQCSKPLDAKLRKYGPGLGYKIGTMAPPGPSDEHTQEYPTGDILLLTLKVEDAKLD